MPRIAIAVGAWSCASCTIRSLSVSMPTTLCLAVDDGTAAHARVERRCIAVGDGLFTGERDDVGRHHVTDGGRHRGSLAGTAESRTAGTRSGRSPATSPSGQPRLPARPCTKAPAAAASSGGIAAGEERADDPGEHVARARRRESRVTLVRDEHTTCLVGDDRRRALQQDDRSAGSAASDARGLEAIGLGRMAPREPRTPRRGG